MRTVQYALLLLVAACHAAAPRPERADSGWSRFRGPNGTGIATGSGYPAQIGPEKSVLWKRSFPAGFSSPVIGAGRLFLTGMEEDRLFTYGLDPQTGATTWRRESPRPRRTSFQVINHPASASPAVDGNVVVVFFDEYGLLAYSTDGEVLWRVPRPSAISGHCTPVVYRTQEGRDLVLLPGSYLLDAYDARTGERVWWVRGLPSEMKAVPALLGSTLWTHGFASPMNNRGQQIYLPEYAVAIEERDANGDGKISPAEVGEPQVEELFVFFDLDADGYLTEVDWDSTRAALEAVNSAMAIRIRDDYRGDVSEAAVQWTAYRDIPQLPSPLVVDSRYYMLADQGGLLTYLDAGTGARLDKVRLKDAVDAYYASPVAADGKVYLVSESGIVTVLAAGGDSEPLCTGEMGENCYATPALEGGRIWLRTASKLYCFEEPEP